MGIYEVEIVESADPSALTVGLALKCFDRRAPGTDYFDKMIVDQ